MRGLGWVSACAEGEGPAVHASVPRVRDWASASSRGLTAAQGVDDPGTPAKRWWEGNTTVVVHPGGGGG